MKKREFNVDVFEDTGNFSVYDENPVVKSLIAETQGEIYGWAYNLGYDMEEFSKHYLQSDFCKYEMDAMYSPYQTELGHICFEILCEEFLQKGIDIPKYEDELLYSPMWIGKMYRYLFYELQTPSAILHRHIPYTALASLDIDCEEMTDAEAVEYVIHRLT